MTTLRQRISGAYRLLTTGSARMSAVAARNWEGWEVNRLRNRGGVRLTSQDTDLNFGTRERMITEARRLCQTFPIAKAIKSKWGTYCVGSCKVKWSTGDDAVDAAYERNWMRRMPTLDATGRHHFRKLARIVAGAVVGDGDIFAQKTKASGIAQIKLIEADRVNNGSLFAADEDRMIGGVKIDSNGRVIGYRVTERDRYGQFLNPADIPAADVLHVFDPLRADAYRGVTGFEVALNALRDLKEIIDAERSAVKLNSKIALLVKSVIGGARGRNAFDSDDSTNASSQSIKEEEVNDAMTAYMFPSEDMKAHQSDRPAGSWLQFSEFLVRQIAIGLNLPFGLVWNMVGTGPAVRFEMATAKRVFEECHEMLVLRFMAPVAAFVTASDIESGALPFHPNWDMFSFAKPRAITIDVGRETSAGIAENKAGLGTATAWFEEDGGDFEEDTERLAKEAAFRRRMAEKYEVPLNDIRADTEPEQSASQQPPGQSRPSMPQRRPEPEPEDNGEMGEPAENQEVDETEANPSELQAPAVGIAPDQLKALFDAAAKEAVSRVASVVAEQNFSLMRQHADNLESAAARAKTDREAAEVAARNTDATLSALNEAVRKFAIDRERFASESTEVARDERNRLLYVRRGGVKWVPIRQPDGRIETMAPEPIINE